MISRMSEVNLSRVSTSWEQRARDLLLGGENSKKKRDVLVPRQDG